MTPLHLEILMRYYTRPGDCSMRSDTHFQFRQELIDRGFLDEISMMGNLKISEKGTVWCKHILNVPDPIQAWVIPKDSQ